MIILRLSLRFWMADLEAYNSMLRELQALEDRVLALGLLVGGLYHRGL